MTEPEKTRYEKLHEHLARATKALDAHRQGIHDAAAAHLEKYPVMGAPPPATTESDEQAAQGE